MKQIIQIPALVESTSTDEMVTAEIGLSLKDGQIVVQIDEWETSFEVPAEHLNQALAALAPRDEPPIPNGLYTMVQHIGQKLSRLEQQIEANPHQRLELEALGENLNALRREVLPRLVVVETWKTRIEGLEQFAEQQVLKNAEIVAQRDTLDEQAETLLFLEGRIDTISKHIAEPPAETAAMALYGGEQ